jgi:hypothetical protein
MVAVLAVAALSLVSVVVAVSARAAGGPPAITSGPMRGIVPPRNLGHSNTSGSNNLIYHGGPVQTSSVNHTVYPIYWGSTWNGAYSATRTAINAFYGGVGGTNYAKTNTEYTDSGGNHVSSAASYGGSQTDTSRSANGGSTSTILKEVAKVTNGHPQAGAYYPVYTDRARGGAGYCAWHSAGTINGIEVQFAYFFALNNDAGCSPYSGSSQRVNLGNVSGHEWSEMETDPQLNAWYDASGEENADKCAWMFNGNQTFGGYTWTIQGNWSNNANGCIWG